MSGGNRSTWEGPAHNISNPTPVTANDPFGKPGIWMVIKYTDDRVINPAIQNFRRLTVTGDFDLKIVNASSSDEGLYKCDLDLFEGTVSSKLYIILLKGKYIVYYLA